VVDLLSLLRGFFGQTNPIDFPNTKNILNSMKLPFHHHSLLVFHLLIVVNASSVLPSSGQARIDEGKVEKTFYVSPDGDDAHTGAQSDKPFASIQKAIDLASDVPSKIVLADGVYRQYAQVGKGKSLLVIEAAHPGKAIISGADVFADWKASEEAGVMFHSWTNKWGVGTELGWWGSTPFNRRREMIYFNDTRLKQRMDGAGGAVAPSSLESGEFTVDDANEKIFMRPPSGADVKNAKIELPVRGYDKESYAWVQAASRPLIRIHEHSNFVLRGLVVKRAANYMKFGAAVEIAGSEEVTSASELPENILVDRLEISNCRNVTVRDSRFNDNGQRGAGMLQVGVEKKGDRRAVVTPRNYLWEDCQFNENNWRMIGIWGDMNDAAGFKSFGQSADHSTFRRCQFNGNFCNGYWQDYAGSNVTLDRCIAENNRGSEAGGYGIINEMTRGPFTVRNCVIRNNNNVGIISSGSPNVTIQDSSIYHNNFKPEKTNNYFCQEIRINSDCGRDSADFDFGLDGWTVTGNTIASLGGIKDGVEVIGYVMEVNGQKFPSGRSPGAEFAYQVISDRNNWSKNAADKDGDKILFSLDSSSNKPDLNLQQWQQQTNRHGKQDLHSKFVYPVDFSNVKDPSLK
jgi:nitrous oxide reductase accessory protein NosL